MSQLRKTLRPASSTTSTVLMVMLVVVLQILLLGAFFYLAERDKHAVGSFEVTVLLVYSIIAIAIAVVTGILRYRWMESENLVRQRLLDVIDAIPDPSAVRDAKGKYIMWNKAAELYHGVKAEHVLGRTPFDLFPKEVARELLSLDAKCFETEITLLHRLVLPPLYGKGQRVATLRIAPVHSAADTAGRRNVHGVVTILHDITDSEREAAALTNITTQLKMALDTSGFGSWIWDLEQKQITYSKQYQSLLHYTGSDFRSDFNFYERIHAGDAQLVVAAAKRSIKGNIAFDQIYRLRCFDDVYRYFHASGEPAQDATGKRFFAGLLCPLDRSAD